MRIVGFGASTSKQSINKTLAEYILQTWFGEHDTELLDLSTYMSLPLYSVDVEAAQGVPEDVYAFINQIDNADALVVSLAEHNGSFATGFKNLYDWASRVPDRKMRGGKPMLLMSCSPGPRGGATVLENAVKTFPNYGAHVVASVAVGSWYDVYNPKRGLVDDDVSHNVAIATQQLLDSLS